MFKVFFYTCLPLWAKIFVVSLSFLVVSFYVKINVSERKRKIISSCRAQIVLCKDNTDVLNERLSYYFALPDICAGCSLSFAKITKIVKEQKK